MIQTVSVHQEMFARTVSVNHLSLLAVTVTQQQTTLTSHALLTHNVSSASVFHLGVIAILRLMILIVSVLLEKFARNVNANLNFLLAVIVTLNHQPQTLSVQLIFGVLAASVRTVHPLEDRDLAKEKGQERFSIHLLFLSLTPPSLSNQPQ